MTFRFRRNDKCRFNYPDFGTPDVHPDYTAHRGHVVTVIKRMAVAERDLECGPGYHIEADDGWRGTADEAELEPIAQRTVTLFQATIEFQTEEQRSSASSTEILFEDDDKDAAIKSVVRWWKSRHKAIPDYFHRLCAFKLWIIEPQRIDDKGNLPSNHGIWVAEWKCDTGLPLDKLVQS